jgi:hypothetical protein
MEGLFGAAWIFPFVVWLIDGALDRVHEPSMASSFHSFPEGAALMPTFLVRRSDFISII